MGGGDEDGCVFYAASPAGRRVWFCFLTKGRGEVGGFCFLFCGGCFVDGEGAAGRAGLSGADVVAFGVSGCSVVFFDVTEDKWSVHHGSCLWLHDLHRESVKVLLQDRGRLAGCACEFERTKDNVCRFNALKISFFDIDAHDCFRCGIAIMRSPDKLSA